MAWIYDSIVSTEDSPEDSNMNLVSVKFKYEVEEPDKVVVFNMPKSFNQDQIQAEIMTFLIGQLNLFIKITKDDINNGYTTILKMISGIDSITETIQGRKERAIENVDALDAQMNLLLAQKNTLNNIIGYLQARAT